MSLEQQLLAHRAQFSSLSDRAYFNYGGQGPLHSNTLAAIQQNYHQIEKLGSFSGAANTWINDEVAKLKAVMSHELQVPSQSMTLTENTTAGCNIALWSVDWQPNDILLLSDCEHPGIIAIATALQARFGIQIAYFPLLELTNDRSDAEIVEIITQHLQPRTRMIVLSHIAWNTGLVLPLQSICQACHERNILVTVDAAQSVGVLPLNLTAIAPDFYAFTGHKWWCGPLGVGGLYVRPEILEQALPTFAGWRSLKPTRPQLQWRQDGQKFEVASSAYPLYGALRVAIAKANEWGTQLQRYNRICELSEYLWQKLTKVSGINCIKSSPPASGLISFTIAGKSPYTVMQRLETEHQVCIRSIPNPDSLRISVHYLTTSDEIDRLVTVLAGYS